MSTWVYPEWTNNSLERQQQHVSHCPTGQLRSTCFPQTAVMTSPRQPQSRPEDKSSGLYVFPGIYTNSFHSNFSSSYSIPRKPREDGHPWVAVLSLG